ncbi:MAG: hypothetical protein CL951_05265 [Erythrobacteraceae bacterium]|nr:hypothetical protein [Erythrobacteraceae bacterium]|tara:strand:- start:3231 stop:4436 length:1206 start_codon:yes stop_codon:yes gene_type:complete
MAAINASKTGSILMIFVALIFLWGFSAVWYFIGAIVGVLLFIPFSLRLKEKSTHEYYTLADYFKYNYGRRVAKIASSITIIGMVGFLVLNLIAGTKLFVFFTGWQFWICALIMLIIVLVYLLLAGYKAVVKTDVIQYAAIIFILIAMAFLMFKGSLIPVTEWNLFQADAKTIVGFFLVGILFPFASPDLWQRVYSSRGRKELKNGLLLSVVIYAVFAFLLALIALTVKVQFPNIDPDLALIYGFQQMLPSGILGLAVVLLFAAIMSSLDTYLFTGASSIVQDFFHADKKTLIKMIRMTIFGLSIIALVLSIAIQSLIIGSYLFIAFMVVLAIAVLATWIKKNVKATTLFFEFVIGLLGLLVYLVFSLFQGEVNPLIVIVTLIFSLLGLGIGSLVGMNRVND